LTARRAYARISKEIARFEPVVIIANPDQVEDAAELCGPDVEVLRMEIDDSWTRDTDPAFLTDGKDGWAGTTFRFNASGGKSEKYENDAKIGRNVLEHAGFGRSSNRRCSPRAVASTSTARGQGRPPSSASRTPTATPAGAARRSRRNFAAPWARNKVVWLPAPYSSSVPPTPRVGATRFTPRT
jgi:agmatine deiminase